MTKTTGLRRRSAVLGAAGTLALHSVHALAQGDRTIKLILPVTAGSGIDNIVRAAQPALGRALGSAIVIENLPGAGGITGASALTRAKPDGRTLGFVSNNHVTIPAIYKNVPFDAIADFTPITVLGASQLVVLARPTLRVADIRELVALLKSKPDAINYASGGNGTILHLATAMLLDEAGASARHIPYKGVAPMVNDLVSGQVDFGIVGLSAVGTHIRNGSLRALGVCGKSRAASEPQIPTVAEQGLPNFEIEGWFAFIGPAKMEGSEVNRIHAAVVAAFETEDVRQAMHRFGARIAPGTPAEAAEYFRTEAARYARIARKVNATVD